MKKIFIILFSLLFFCSVFSQEEVHAIFLGESYNGTAIPPEAIKYREIFLEMFRSGEQPGWRDFRSRYDNFVWGLMNEFEKKHRQIPHDVTHLIVRGAITPKTIWFMRDSLPNLTYLDLSQAIFIPDVHHARVIKKGSCYILSYPWWFDKENPLNNDTLCALCDAFFTYFGLRNSRNHRNLRKVILPEVLPVIGQNAFRGTPIDSIVMPRNIRRIGNRAFMNCVNLRHISLPDGLEEIGEQAFSGSGLTRIEIPASVRRIGLGLFGNTPNLREISVHWEDPASVMILESNNNRLVSWSELLNEDREFWEMILKNIPIRETKLIVPRGTREKYLAIPEWRFFQIVERE